MLYFYMLESLILAFFAVVYIVILRDVISSDPAKAQVFWGTLSWAIVCHLLFAMVHRAYELISQN